MSLKWLRLPEAESNGAGFKRGKPCPEQGWLDISDFVLPAKRDVGRNQAGLDRIKKPAHRFQFCADGVRHVQAELNASVQDCALRGGDYLSG